MSSVADLRRQAETYAALREAAAPAPGDDRASERKCPRCPAFYWEWKGKETRLCPKCAALAMVEHNASAAAKTGAGYEKVVRGQLRHWRAEAERLGLADA